MATVSPLPGSVLSYFACWNCPILGTSNKNTILLWGRGNGALPPNLKIKKKKKLKKEKQKTTKKITPHQKKVKSLTGKNVV